MKKFGNKLRFFLAVAFFVCSFHYSVLSQSTVESFPVQFTQFINSYPLTNPASIGTNPDNKATVGYQQPVKGFTDVSTYYFNFNFTPFRKKTGKKRKNVVGVRLYNDKEGAYIKRSRFYAMYAFHTRLNRRVNFSGGIDFGGMNYAVKSTPTTGGATNFNFDANSGIWIYNADFHIGLSINQIFKSSLQPLDEITVLPVHFNISASKTIVNTKVFLLRPHVIITFPYYSDVSWRGCLHGEFVNKIITEIGTKYKNNISFCVGVKNIEVGKNFFECAVSYTLPTQSLSYSINTMELEVGYSF